MGTQGLMIGLLQCQSGALFSMGLCQGLMSGVKLIAFGLQLLVRCLQLAQNGKVAFEITIQCGLLLEQLRDLLVDGADPLAHLVDPWSAA